MEVLGNILENTFRFAHRQILFKISDFDDQVLIEISNDGPAIDNATSQTLFQRGVRADQQNPGTGLGLALCDEIIHSYKGAIWFDTPEHPSMGVTLKILLPQA